MLEGQTSYNASNGLDKNKKSVFSEPTQNYYDNYQYGQNIRKLKPGIEVEINNSLVFTQITGGTFSVPNDSQVQMTGMSTILGDTSLTGTANQITIQKSGIYQIFASTRWNSQAGGLRNVHVSVNGTVNFSDFGVLNSSNGSTSYMFKILALNAGDYLKLELYQNSGTSVSTTYGNLGVLKIG